MDRRPEPARRDRVGAAGRRLGNPRGHADVPPAEVIVAFDPPDVERLRLLLAAGEVVLFVPPGTEKWAARIADPRRPLRLPGLVDAAETAAALRRATVARAIEAGGNGGALLALGPLLERYDATAVAARALRALDGAPTTAAAAQAIPAPAARDAPEASGTVKVWVGLGRNDGATPNDLVAVLTKEVRVPKEWIGRIEVRDAYTLVELPGGDAQRIADALSGKEIRRKRITARLDRMRERPGGTGRDRTGPGANRRDRPRTGGKRP